MMNKKLKNLFLALILVATPLFNSCGISGAPPLSIPAPAPAKIRVTSPDEDGLATVTGSAGAVTGGNSVRVTNLSASGAAPLQVLLDLLIRSAWAQAATRVTVTAANDGSFSAEIAADADDTLSIVQIDPATNEESDATEIAVPDNSPPLSFSPVAVTVDGSGNGYAVGSSGGTGLLAVIDLELNQVTSTVNLSTNAPQGIDFDPTNNKLVITDQTNNLVLFVSLTDPTIQTTLAVTGPQGVSVDTLTGRAVIGTTDVTASVVLIDLATETVFATTPITNTTNPAAVYQGSPSVDADGGRAVIVSNFDDGSSQITAKDLIIPAITNQEIITNSSLQGAGLISATRAIVVDAGGNQVYFADLDPLGSAAVAVAVGANPRRVAIDAANNRGLVTNFDDHTLSVIDLAERAVSSTEETGINPQGVAFFPAGNLTLVENSGNDSVTILH